MNLDPKTLRFLALLSAPLETAVLTHTEEEETP